MISNANLWSRPRTPPQSRKRGPPAYVSPDRSRLAKVLAVGGQLDVTASATPLGSERVEFYAIEPPSLHELLDPELQHLSRFTCTPDEASQGFLAIQSNLSIGCGTFKNAHRGWITLHHLRDAVLGTTKSELVVVKRFKAGLTFIKNNVAKRLDNDPVWQSCSSIWLSGSSEL
ncbi:hypothetical protein R3P38DRAFT_3362322 [Favolaschia claudopus]|uniref:Uncharacterized protein n=1 Tax=Favolaschia claudopus TaxID=2862362 RepID=A0AAW0APS4_9AGAR